MSFAQPESVRNVTVTNQGDPLSIVRGLSNPGIFRWGSCSGHGSRMRGRPKRTATGMVLAPLRASSGPMMAAAIAWTIASQ